MSLIQRRTVNSMQEQGISGKDQPLCLDCARHPPDSFGHEPRNFAAATPQTDKDVTASGDRATTFASIIHSNTRRQRQRAINSKKHFSRISTSSRHNCQQNTTPTSSRSFPFLSLFELSLTQQQSSPNTNNPTLAEHLLSLTMRSSTLLALAASLSSSAAVYQGFNYGSTKSDGVTFRYQADFESLFSTAKNLVGTSAFTSARLYTMIVC
jgi:hypothetical protein